MSISTWHMLLDHRCSGRVLGCCVSSFRWSRTQVKRTPLDAPCTSPHSTSTAAHGVDAISPAQPEPSVATVAPPSQGTAAVGGAGPRQVRTREELEDQSLEYRALLWVQTLSRVRIDGATTHEYLGGYTCMRTPTHMYMHAHPHAHVHPPTLVRTHRALCAAGDGIVLCQAMTCLQPRCIDMDSLRCLHTLSDAAYWDNCGLLYVVRGTQLIRRLAGNTHSIAAIWVRCFALDVVFLGDSHCTLYTF